jgi:hypothetical protein
MTSRLMWGCSAAALPISRMNSTHALAPARSSGEIGRWPHPGKVLADRDSEAPQLLFITYTGLHQHFGGMDSTQRQHHFARGAQIVNLSLVEHFDTGTPLVYRLRSLG